MPASHRHRSLLIILGYVAVVLILGAILAPALFFAAQSVMRVSPDGALAKVIGDKEFPSYFNRAALLVALVGLWPLLKAMRMSLREVTGNEPRPLAARSFSRGFALAFVLLLAMGFGFMFLGAYRLQVEPRWLDLGGPILSAMTVAILEEFLFRGAVLGVLVRSLGARQGLWWATIIFAAVHFLKPPADGLLANENVTWTSGFWVVAQLFRGFGQVDNLLAEFLTLMAVGWVLAKVRLASGGLWGSIGLHAGWVFGLKYFGGLKKNAGSLTRGDWIPWIGDNLKVGLAPFAVVLLTGLIMLYFYRNRSSSQKEIAKQGR